MTPLPVNTNIELAGVRRGVVRQIRQLVAVGRRRRDAAAVVRPRAVRVLGLLQDMRLEVRGRRLPAVQ